MTRLITLLMVVLFVALNKADVIEPKLYKIPCLSRLLEGKAGTPRICEKEILGLTESLRKLLKEGNDALNIPSFDPLIIVGEDTHSLNLDNALLRGNLNLTDVKLHGIPDFTVPTGKVTISGWKEGTLHLVFNFETIVLSVKEYAGKLNLFEMLDLYGTGHMNFAFSNFEIGLKVIIKIGKGIQIKDVEVMVKLRAIDTKITGLLDDEFMSDLISRQLSDTLTTLAKEEQERISQILQEVVMFVVDEFINPILAGEKENLAANEDHYSSVLAEIKQTITSLIEKRFFMN